MAVSGDDYVALADVTSSIMKELWARIKNAVDDDNKNVAWPRMKDNQGGEVEVAGAGMWRVRVPYVSAANRNIGPTVGDTRHKSGHSTTKNFYFETTKYDGTFGITQDLVMMTKKNSVAAINQLTLEMKNLKAGLTKRLSQDFHLDGTGTSAYLSKANSGGSVYVVAPCYAEVGDVVNIIDATDGTTMCSTNDDAITAIGDVSWDSGLPTQTVTITDTATGTAAGDMLIRSTAADGTSAAIGVTYKDLAIGGLGGVINDANPAGGNFGNRDRTSGYTELIALVHDGSASSAYPYIDTTYFRTLSRNLMDKLWDAQVLKHGKASVILGTPAMQREYVSMETMNTERSPARVKSVDWAVEGPSYRGVPVVADPYCLPCRFYFLDDKAIGKKEVWPIQPWGDGLTIATTGAFAYTYTLSTRLQVVSGMPWAQALLCDIAEEQLAIE